MTLSERISRGRGTDVPDPARCVVCGTVIIAIDGVISTAALLESHIAAGRLLQSCIDARKTPAWVRRTVDTAGPIRANKELVR